VSPEPGKGFSPDLLDPWIGEADGIQHSTGKLG
jgi:hypothetical protein